MIFHGHPDPRRFRAVVTSTKFPGTWMGGKINAVDIGQKTTLEGIAKLAAWACDDPRVAEVARMLAAGEFGGAMRLVGEALRKL